MAEEKKCCDSQTQEGNEQEKATEKSPVVAQQLNKQRAAAKRIRNKKLGLFQEEMSVSWCNPFFFTS